MSIVPLSEPPPVLEITTVAPPAVRLLLFASRACTVIVWVLVPLAVMEAVGGLMVECAALAAPGEKAMLPLVTAAKLVIPAVAVAVNVRVSDIE